MKFTKLALTLMCACVLLCGCHKNSDIVLKINDKNITRGEFYGDYNKIKNVQLKQAPKELQGDNAYPALIIKDKFTNDVIVRELLNQEFDKRKITASDEEIKAKKEQFIKQMGSVEQFNNIIRENGITEERLKQDMASEVKMEKLVKSLPKQKVTDTQAQKFYKENKFQFILPERVRVSHILIDTNEQSIRRIITDADKDAKLSQAEIDKKVKDEVLRKENLAKEVRQKAVSNPKKFSDLARQYSDDEVSAKQGGDLGFVTREQVVKEFGDAAFSQKINVVGPLVKSQFGEHIILVKDKAAGGVQPFSSVKEDIKMYLSEQAKYESVQKLIDGLKANAKIEYVDASLDPKALKKAIEEALPKQQRFERSQNAPKSKKKILEKMENAASNNADKQSK